MSFDDIIRKMFAIFLIIFLILFILLILTMVVGITYTQYKKTYDCKEYDLRCFRTEGTGGFAGGSTSVETVCENKRYDRIEEVCVRW